MFYATLFGHPTTAASSTCNASSRHQYGLADFEKWQSIMFWVIHYKVTTRNTNSYGRGGELVLIECLYVVIEYLTCLVHLVRNDGNRNPTKCSMMIVEKVVVLNEVRFGVIIFVTIEVIYKDTICE